VRSGVAPDHPKIKSVSDTFEQIAAHERFRWFGNVDLGGDVTREDLLSSGTTRWSTPWERRPVRVPRRAGRGAGRKLGGDRRGRLVQRPPGLPRPDAAARRCPCGRRRQRQRRARRGTHAVHRRRLSRVEQPEHRQLLHAYATWQILRRLRRRATNNTTTGRTPTSYPRTQLLVATRFLGWLDDRCCRGCGFRGGAHAVAPASSWSYTVSEGAGRCVVAVTDAVDGTRTGSEVTVVASRALHASTATRSGSKLPRTKAPPCQRPRCGGQGAVQQHHTDQGTGPWPITVLTRAR
jgi:hypothetical protein